MADKKIEIILTPAQLNMPLPRQEKKEEDLKQGVTCIRRNLCGAVSSV